MTIILVFILFLTTATHHHQQQQNALAQINDSVFKTYENSTYGIRMQYPSDWKKVEPSQVSQASNFNIIVGFISPKENALYTSSAAAVSVGIHNLSSQDITPDQYTDTHINSIRKQTNLLESNATALKGNSSNNLAHKVVYINSEGQKIMQVWTVKGDKAYHITYAANETRYSDYLPPIQKMINSFEIVDLTEFNNNSAPSVISNSTGLFPLASSADGYTTKTTTGEAATDTVATAPSDFNFAAAGDWDCTSDTENTVNNILAKNPELVLGLGDYSYEDSANCWFNITQPIDNIMKITIGNHDIHDLEAFMEHFGLSEQYYSFDYQNVHFISLGTEEEYLDMSNDKAKEQLAFVQSDLEKASSNPNIDWIVVYFHRLMYSSPSENPVYPTLRNTYHPLFNKYGVDLVLQAHNHNYQRTYPIKFNSTSPSAPIETSRNTTTYTDPDGETFATVGTRGKDLFPFTGKEDYIIKLYEGFGILNVDITNNDGKMLTGKFYANNNGTIIDQFTIIKK